VLRDFPSFREFEQRKRVAGPSDEGEGEDDDTDDTPEEALETALERVQRPRRQEILDTILNRPPSFFERLVLDVLTGAGYGGAADDTNQHLGKSGDGGVDGVIKEDSLGLELIYIQAKRYAPDAPVGRPAIQQFAGSLEGFRARKGVFITTSTFTQEAKDYARQIEKRIALIDGETLIDLMLRHDVGVRTIRSFAVKAVDLDYFDQ
jgi:restriction system protein